MNQQIVQIYSKYFKLRCLLQFYFKFILISYNWDNYYKSTLSLFQLLTTKIVTRILR